MKIIVDTQEKRNMHILEEFNNQNIKWTASKLKYGDYAIEGYEKCFVVERKANLLELAGNLSQQRIRFETELAKARADKCEILLLLEDDKARAKVKLRIEMDRANVSMDTRFKKTWRSKFSGNSMAGSIKAFKDRYKLKLLFCKKCDAGNEIVKYFKEALHENNNKAGIGENE